MVAKKKIVKRAWTQEDNRVFEVAGSPKAGRTENLQEVEANGCRYSRAGIEAGCFFDDAGLACNALVARPLKHSSLSSILTGHHRHRMARFTNRAEREDELHWLEIS